jgi:hypothetical protein
MENVTSGEWRQLLTLLLAHKHVGAASERRPGSLGA